MPEVFEASATLIEEFLAKIEALKEKPRSGEAPGSLRCRAAG
jgi:hypothetical protein